MSGGTSRNWSKWRRNHAWKYRKSNFESLSHGVDERKAKRNFGTTVLSVINSKLQAFRGPVASVVLNSPEDYEVLKKGNYKPSHHVVCGILYGRADQQPTVDLIPPYKISYCEPPHFYERMF